MRSRDVQSTHSCSMVSTTWSSGRNWLWSPACRRRRQIFSPPLTLRPRRFRCCGKNSQSVPTLHDRRRIIGFTNEAIFRRIKRASDSLGRCLSCWYTPTSGSSSRIMKSGETGPTTKPITEYNIEGTRNTAQGPHASLVKLRDVHLSVMLCQSHNWSYRPEYAKK